MKNRVRFITHSSIIAALYVILTGLSAVLHLASGPIQIRLSEALTVLAAFTPAAIPGLFIGCTLANFLTGSLLWDIVFGSIAMLLFLEPHYSGIVIIGMLTVLMLYIGG